MFSRGYVENDFAPEFINKTWHASSILRKARKIERQERPKGNNTSQQHARTKGQQHKNRRPP
ncbi:MAG: hypothetical protein WC913_09115, partial [Desulfuromonas sp.]